MKRHIPDDFWYRVHTELCDINIRRRAEMEAIKQRLHLKMEKSFLKHASYCGAIRVPDDFPKALIKYTNEETGERFLDPRNAIYCDVFKAVWPNVTFISAPGTVGDLIEALLGLTWVKKDRGETIPPEMDDFVQMLEQLSLMEYSLQTWYGAKGA